MARIIGGLTTSHVPIIGQTMAKGGQQESDLKPFFDAFGAVHGWLAEAKPDVAVVVYNDHGLNFFLDKMPTFALGAAADYRNADEGWGPVDEVVFQGEPSLSWHMAQTLVDDEFDITTCQEMAFDHAGATALELLWGHGAPPVTIVPVVLNAVQPPLPSMKRCYALGQSIGRAIRSWDSDKTVLVIGSGGLSHQLGTYGGINEAFDQQCMKLMAEDPDALGRYSNAEIVAEAGNQGLEIMTWVTMRGAVSGPVEVVASKYHAPVSHTGGAMMLLDARHAA
jgi:protocatechuate 4,5-dioxygenase beta chain